LLLAHPIDLSNTTQPVITFWQYYYTEGNRDYCHVEISDDGGFTWEEIVNYSGANTAWHKEQFDLSLYKSTQVLIRFRLRANGPNNQYDGWHLDDVELYDLSGNRAPTIESFLANPTFGKTPLDVSFETEASDTDGSIAEYIWDFNGDGANDDTTTTGFNTYRYTSSGAYNATCRAIDDQGTSSSPAIVQINVYSDSTRIVSVPDDSASVDASFILPIQINDVSGIAGAEFRLDYDPTILEATNVSATNLISGFTLTDTISAGSVAISMARATGLASGSGDFVNITFHVSSDAIAGQTSELTLDQVSLYDADTDPIDLSTVNGLFTVKKGTDIDVTLKRIFIQPGLDTLELSQTAIYSAFGVDTDDNTVEIDVIWSYEPVYGSPGIISPNSGHSTVFTATGVGDGLIAASYTADTESFTDTAYVLVGKTKGDVNIDEEVNVPDAILCLQIAADILAPSPYQDWSADFDYSRVVTAADAIGILIESLNNLLPKIGSISSLFTNPRDPAVIYPAKFFNKSSNLLSVSLFVENRMDVCGLDLTIAYNRSDLTLVDISSSKPSSLLAKNIAHSKLSTINLEGLSKENGEIVTLHFKRNNTSDLDIRFTSIDLFDQKGNAIDTQMELKRPEQITMPSQYVLHQNYPNPFNPSTTIRYDLPESGEVFLAIYNITGQIVQSLVKENMDAGTHAVTWTGSDHQGNMVSSGIYFYKIVFKNGEWFDVKKMLFVK
jgi:PKD repeat protein